MATGAEVVEVNEAGELIVIGCGKQKVRKQFAPAIDMYTGSLFKAHKRLAQSKGGPHFILSGKYGLIRPTLTIPNYSLSMAMASRAERDIWSDKVYHGFKKLPQPKQLVVICGAPYLGAWYQKLLNDGWSIATPLKGLTVGRRLATIKRILGD